MADEQTTKQILSLLSFFSPKQHIISFYYFITGIKRTIQIPTAGKSEVDRKRNKNSTLTMFYCITL